MSALMDEHADGKETAAKAFGLMHDHTVNPCHSGPATGDSSCSDFIRLTRVSNYLNELSAGKLKQSPSACLISAIIMVLS